MADDVQARGVDEILDLYEQYGADHYDEALSQLDHALQTAALAEAAGASDALIAASLLHDVGHLLTLASGGRPAATADEDQRHEGAGARYLASVFSPEVTAPIALHVQAKRYRCGVDAGYTDRLSEGSRASLAIQGGPLEAAEVARFEQLPGCDDAVRLREWDDEGKVDGLDVPPLRHYRPLLDALARSRPPQP
jgi:phosphonate degradation associated HDIG domain protein